MAEKSSFVPDLDAAARGYAAFLSALGVGRPESGHSPEDVEHAARLAATLMADWMRGISAPRPSLSPMPAPDGQRVALRGIPFCSICGHHFVPFFGTVDVEYVPRECIAGLGGFSRIIDHYARRPQFQEDLCAQIADHIVADLHPAAVRVRIRARQMCLEMQGRGTGIEVESTCVRGDESRLG